MTKKICILCWNNQIFHKFVIRKSILPMKNILLGVLLGLLVLSSCGDAKRDKIGKTEVTIQTDYGKIVVRLY